MCSFFLQHIRQFRGSETTVASHVEERFREVLVEFIQEFFHEPAGSIAAVLCSLTELSHQQVTGDAIIAHQGMIAVCLIVIVEGFAFLPAIGIKQRGVQIQEQMLRWIDGVYHPAHGAHDPAHLFQGIFIHPVEEPGPCWLGSKCFFAKNRCHDRVMGQFIGVIVPMIGSDGLVYHLKQVIRICMMTGSCMIIGLEVLSDKIFETGFGSEFLDEKESCIGGKIAAGEVNLKLLIAFQSKGV